MLNTNQLFPLLIQNASSGCYGEIGDQLLSAISAKEEDMVLTHECTNPVSSFAVLCFCKNLFGSIFQPILKDDNAFLSEVYEYLCSGMYPMPEAERHFILSRQCYYLIFLDILDYFLQQENPTGFDPFTTIPTITEEELEESPTKEEYLRFRKSIQDSHFIPLLRICRDIKPFDPASHTIGVHFLALHMARQAKKAGLPIDIALVSASSFAHDIGKFGCYGKDAMRIPYLHYYYTFQWLNEKQLPVIAHIAANHSTWDLEFENLSLESLLLIYADFRVRGTRENGREVMRIYTLAESYDMIFSKLYNMTTEKELRYKTVYAKLKDLENFLVAAGCSTDPLNDKFTERKAENPALLNNEGVLPAIVSEIFHGNVILMNRLNGESSFIGILEKARAEKNLNRIRNYLHILEEYSTYMTVGNKKLTLDFLYELLMHSQPDVRRRAALIMGSILANSGPRYRKELPDSVPNSADIPATSAVLKESVSLWIHYLNSCLHPDVRISERHAIRIANSIKMIVNGLMQQCIPSDVTHYVNPLLDAIRNTSLNELFPLIDSLYYVPMAALDKDSVSFLIGIYARILQQKGQDALRVVALRRLLQILEADSNYIDQVREVILHISPCNEIAELFLECRLKKWIGIPSREIAIDVPTLYLNDLKNAYHWMTKLTQLEMLEADLSNHPENAFHTAMHFSNLISVSEHLPVRERAGDHLVSIFRYLSIDQKNEIIVDLVRELETGRNDVSFIIASVLGKLLSTIPVRERDEALDSLEMYIKTGTVYTANAALQTIGILLGCDGIKLNCKEKLLSLLLTGISHYRNDIHQYALSVLCNDVFGEEHIPLHDRCSYLDLIGKKLLTLLKEQRDGTLLFFSRCTALNKLYRLIVSGRIHLAFHLIKERPAAFFPGTFDPFSAGHRQIVKDMTQKGYVVYLAIDEFSWSKQPLPKMLRRAIADMSVAGDPYTFLFPDEIPVNIASVEDLAILRQSIPENEIYLVTGSDVILNASAYRINTPGSAGDMNHIIFLRSGQQVEETLKQKLRAKVEYLQLGEFYENISSTLIREYVDKNMDISMYVDPMVQNYIYEKGLYLRSPQEKKLHSQSGYRLSVYHEGPDHIRAEIDNKLTCWSVSGKLVSDGNYYNETGSITAAEHLRNSVFGKVLFVAPFRGDIISVEDCVITVNELLVRAMEDGAAYAVCTQKGDDMAADILSQLGFISLPGEKDMVYVDMKKPIVLIQDLYTRFKEPHKSAEDIRNAVNHTRPLLRHALAKTFPGKLIAVFHAEHLEEGVINKVREINGVQDFDVNTKKLGPYMCVPYGKILSGEVVPNTVTKTIHAVKAYGNNIKTFSILEHPGYSNLINQTRMIRSFRRPVILVDDLLHKGYRIEKLDSYFRAEDLQIQRIVVGIMSGRGKDLMKLQGREADCVYFIPNLHFWFTESLLYPFIGGDSAKAPVSKEGLLPTINLIMPYQYPSYIDNTDHDGVMQLSRTCLENAFTILSTLERFHQNEFRTVLTVRRLAEAFQFPRVPYRGTLMQYDVNAVPSRYVAEDLDSFFRLSSTT